MVDGPRQGLRLLDATAPMRRYVLPRPGGGNGTGRSGQKGSYDAAKDVVDNRRHFQAADALDAVKANAYATRSVIRKRARYEAANNCYARGMIETVANDMVGIGPRLQMLTTSEPLNARIERDFAAWADAVDLPGVLRTMRKARIDSGESFLLLIDNPELVLDGVEPSPVTLDLRIIEADQVETPTITKSNEWTEGIRFNKHGRPVEYAVLKNHPGGLLAGWEYTVTPASAVIHWFRIDRPGQIRGLPEMHPALALFAQLRRWTLATLTSAELVAELTMMMKTQAGLVDGAQNVGYADGTSSGAQHLLVDIDRGMMTFLPMGWEPFQVDPKQPSTTYPDGKHEVLKEIGRVLNIPWNVVAGDSSGYNYASGRLDFQTYDRTIKVEQNDCERKVLNRIFAAWLREAAFIYNLENRRLPHSWFWRRRQHVDPLKEAQAQKIRLESNTTTLEAECAEHGEDWREVLKQRRDEIALQKEYGIPVAAPKDGKSSGGEAPEDQGETTEESRRDDE